MRVPYLFALSFSFSTLRPYAVDGASYLERVVGDDGSSRELRRTSEAAASFKIPARVDDAADSEGLGVVVGRVVAGTGFTFAGSSSASDSSSELDSSSEDSDSSFLAAGAVEAGVVDWRNRL